MIDNLDVHYTINDATNDITIVTEAVRFDNNLASISRSFLPHWRGGNDWDTNSSANNFFVL